MTDLAVKEKVIDENQDGESSVDRGNQKQFLSFAAGEEEFAIELIKIREIKNYGDLTRIPNAPSFMRGVMNLRGAVIPIFDLKLRLDMGGVNSDESSVVIIVGVMGKQIGILVDSVSDILTIDASEIAPAPRVDSGKKAQCLEGVIAVKGKMVVILQLEQLFSDEVLRDAKKGDVTSNHVSASDAEVLEEPANIDDE